MLSDVQKTYVVISGPPGSGKTTLARGVAQTLGLPLIAKDTIKKALELHVRVVAAPGIDEHEVGTLTTTSAMMPRRA